MPATKGTKHAKAGSKMPQGPKKPQAPFDRLEEEKLMRDLGYCFLKKYVPLDIESIPFETRLNVKRSTALERTTQFVEKPAGYIPHISMPAWSLLKPDQRLSYIPVPGVSLPYARGIVGEPLPRKCENFNLSDPNNYETGVAIPYDALHDPYLKRHFEKPRVHKLLVANGLVTQDNFPIENVTLMNQYRRYLFRTVYNDNINSELRDRDTINRNYRNQMLNIKKFLNKTEGRGVVVNNRIERARREKFKEMVRNVKVAAELKLVDEQRRNELHAKREEEDYRRRLKNFERAEQRDMRLLEKKRKELKDRADLCNKIAVLDYGIAQRNKTDRDMYNRTFKHYRMEWMDAKWTYQKGKVEQEKFIEKLVNDECLYRAEQRQRKVERQRRAFPKFEEKRKAAKKHLMEITRKYWDKWRAYVFLKRSRRPDEHHKSYWDINEDVDDTLKDLYEVSGYEKLDDFIMSIVILKRKIKAELDAEELEEAAASGGGRPRDSTVSTLNSEYN